jgi:hypothetical protein
MGGDDRVLERQLRDALQNFACTHVENPSLRAFRITARIGCPAARCRSSAASNSSCHGRATSLTGTLSSERIVAQCRAQNGVSKRRRSRARATSAVSATDLLLRLVADALRGLHAAPRATSAAAG